MRRPENHFTHLTHLDSFVSHSTSRGDTLINTLTLAKDAITASDVKGVEAQERQLFSDQTINAASNLRYDQQHRSRSGAENPQTNKRIYSKSPTEAGRKQEGLKVAHRF